MHHCFWQKFVDFWTKELNPSMLLRFWCSLPQVIQLRKQQISKRKRTAGQPTNHQPPQGKKYQTLMTRRFSDSKDRPGTPRSFRIFSRLLHGDLAVAPYVRWWCPCIFWHWFKASKRWTMWISSGRWWLFSSLQICEIPQPLQTSFKTTSSISKQLSKSYRSYQAHMRLQIKPKKMQLWLIFLVYQASFSCKSIVFWWPCPPR